MFQRCSTDQLTGRVEKEVLRFGLQETSVVVARVELPAKVVDEQIALGIISGIDSNRREGMQMVIGGDPWKANEQKEKDGVQLGNHRSFIDLEE